MGNTERISLEVPESMLEAIVAAAAERALERMESELDRQAWPEWLSVETVAPYLDVSPERLRTLQARREIPFPHEGPGCRVFFRRRELDECMAAYLQPPRGRHAGESRRSPFPYLSCWY